MIFRHLGVPETNPLAAFLMESFGNLLGLLLLKAVAVTVGIGCGVTTHPVVLRRINAVYFVIIAINYLTICNAVRG